MNQRIDVPDGSSRRSTLGRLALSIGVALALYLATYLAYRQSHKEVWAEDGQTYVIFPDGAPLFWFAMRPLMYVDEALTGMRFHIGPHRI